MTKLDALSADLAEGTRAIAELAEIFAGAARQREADLAAWRSCDRQAPAPLYPPVEQP